MHEPTAMKVSCPLCGKADAKFQPEGQFACVVCGRFDMTFQLRVDRDMQGYPLHPYLSAATRKASESRRPLILTLDNWQELEEEQRSIRISEKLSGLLRLVAKRSGGPGGNCKIIINHDHPLIAARDPAELMTYLDYFVSQGILTFVGKAPDGLVYALTVPGW
jgi:hypothetical protein